MSIAVTKLQRVHSADEDRVALEAREVQLSVWNLRSKLYAGVVPANPVELLDPGVALLMLGFETVTDASLGEMHENGRRLQTAGLIDWKERVVRISPTCSYEEQRFTAAHELGHAVLHPGVHGVHRDRPVSGPMFRRDAREVQADKFASYFLMPERLVRRRFQECFGLEHFYLCEDTAFLLFCSTVDEVKRKYRVTRDLSRALAGASSFGGVHFDSLHRYFRVSPTTMAIRLEELGLVH